MSLKVLNSLLLFFNQNDYPISKDEFNDLQVDDVISIYELLLEQNLNKQKQIEMSKMWYNKNISGDQAS